MSEDIRRAAPFVSRLRAGEDAGVLISEQEDGSNICALLRVLSAMSDSDDEELAFDADNWYLDVRYARDRYRERTEDGDEKENE